MAKYKPQHRRLLFIDRKIKGKSYPNCTSLAAEWECCSKTIQRDLEYLQDELDAPIKYDSVRHGYYYTEPNFSMPAINISESDLFAVCIAERSLNQFRDTPLYGKLSSVFSKIKDSLPDKTSVKPAWVDDRILLFPEPTTKIDTKIWDTIAKGIRDNKRLSINYATPDRKSTARKVDPYYLVNYKGEWYLSSYCHARNSIRTFAVSRIKKAEILKESFLMPEGMDKNKMFGDQFGIIWKEKHHKVRIRFTSEVAPYISERQWHPGQKIKQLKNGGLVIEFTTNHLNEVKDWILSWGPGARVLGPGELIDKVRKSLKEALEGYRG